jgi:acetyl-CoA carboxylase carboxyltransferase component
MADETVENNENRKVFVAQISFDATDSGPIQLLARDEKHALELIPKMLGHLKNLVVHDIIEQSKIEKPQEPEATPSASEPSKVVH